MWYPYNGIFSHKKEWSSGAFSNKDEPWKDDAKWKKPVTKDYILYEIPEQGNV